MEIKCETARSERRVHWTYRESRYRQSIWKTWKGKEHESCLCSGSGGFIEGSGLVYVFPQAFKNQLEQGWRPMCYSLESRGLGIEMSSTCVLEYVYDSFARSFSPGPSFSVIYSREIINSLSLIRRTNTFCITRHV